MNIRNTLLRFLTGSAVLGSLFIGGIAFAQTSFPQNGGMPPGVVGTVLSINGTILTVQSMAFGQNTSATTYTINASGATVTKSNLSASLSDISVGDIVMIEGTVSGTNIAATSIHDGIGPRPQGIASSTRPTIQQNSRTTTSQTVFTRTLKQGMTGADVKALQVFLNSNGFIIATSGTGSIGNETTYFGSGTKKALIRFQNAHAADILTPNGLTQGSGIFGPATIKLVNSMQGTSYTP
ncbi:MAG: peptidoglycan-binding protein [Patescibacteria group bacterium]|nr:peptidoglycan-binding protein [Patescibacteria group bacterium]